MNRVLRYLYLRTFVRYFPAPAFLVLGIYYTINPNLIVCGSGLDMTLMWYLMGIAHINPWIEQVETCLCPNRRNHK